MWPWPDSATLGIQKPRGLVAAGSKSVPDWISVGVPVRLPTSYQREPLRPPPLWAAPLVLTSMLWAVQSELKPVILFLWIAAANRRLSSASRFLLPVSPLWTWEIGLAVAGTVTKRLPDREGVPPGLETRRRANRLNETLSTPTK